MSKLRLEGIFVPCVTPFTKTGGLDLRGLRECTKFWLKAGVSGLAPCGSNGEAPYLSRQERSKVIETVLDEVNGKAPVIAGTGTMSTSETITLTKDAADLGVDAALIVTPFYFKLSNKEIQEHYGTISDAVDIPIIIYTVPKFTGVTLEPSQISKLTSENKKIVGIKDSGANLGTIIETIRQAGNKIAVLAGTADVALATLQAGGKGAILAVANVFPHLCSRMYDAFKKEQHEQACKLQNQVSHANEVLVKKLNQISAIKEAMHSQGLPSGYPRRPVLPLDAQEKETLLNLIKEVEQ
jgi:4-hydroxy-tetrahydrodipicolinate synthase